MTRRELRRLRRMQRDWARICRKAEDHVKLIGGKPCPFCRNRGDYDPQDRPVSVVANYPRHGDSSYGWVAVECCNVCAASISDPESSLYDNLTRGAEVNPNSWYVVAHPLKEEER